MVGMCGAIVFTMEVIWGEVREWAISRTVMCVLGRGISHSAAVVLVSVEV